MFVKNKITLLILINYPSFNFDKILNKKKTLIFCLLKFTSKLNLETEKNSLMKKNQQIIDGINLLADIV